MPLFKFLQRLLLSFKVTSFINHSREGLGVIYKIPLFSFLGTDVPCCRVTVGDGGRLVHPRKEMRNKLGTGHRSRGDIVMGDALTRNSPSVDPGTVLLAEMHRNIFSLAVMMVASLFPPCAATRHPWPLAGLVIVLSAQ